MIFGPFKLVLRIISLVVTLAILYFAVTFAQIWMTGHEHSSQQAQGILVFGTTEDNGVPSPELRARLDDALTLYRQHRAAWVAVTGGNRPGDVYTEAGVSASYLEQHGVPKARIMLGAGDNTWQNVATVLPALKAHGIVSVITVTDPFHEFRAMAISSAEGLKPVSVPVADSPTIKFSLWKYYLKETVAVGVGRTIGYGRLSSLTNAMFGIVAPFGAALLVR